MDHKFPDARIYQATKIMENLKQFLPDLQAPIIMTGDFNMPLSEEFLAVIKPFIDTRTFVTAQGPENTDTAYGSRAEKKIDHILINDPKQIKVESLMVVAEEVENGNKIYLSDHRSVIAKLEIG